jgi:hypothetical protein
MLRAWQASCWADVAISVAMMVGFRLHCWVMMETAEEGCSM